MPFSPDLQRGLEAVRAFEVPGRPCLARERLSGALANLRRQRDIQQDSNWLSVYLRNTYPERLLFSGLNRRGNLFVYIVRLTGSRRIPPQRLRDKAANVPVLIEYGAPWSFAEIKRRASAASDRPQMLVPDLQGTGLAADPGFGAVRMDVYSQADDLAPISWPNATHFADCMPAGSDRVH